jgi:hypothetical protein
MANNEKRVRLLICLSASVFVMVAMVVWSTMQPLPFDSSQWKADRANRRRMIDDLLTNHTLKGQNREQINDLLGKPQAPDTVGEAKSIYEISSDGIMDDMWLELRFDADRVVEVRYYPD